MLREAYPGGVPDTAFSGTVDLTSDNEEEDIKTEIKEEGEWLIYIYPNTTEQIWYYILSLICQNNTWTAVIRMWESKKLSEKGTYSMDEIVD